MSFHSDVLGEYTIWLLDFDCCHPMTMDDTGVSQAVTAFFRNDPFFPRPGHAADTLDEALWTQFRDRFLNTSAEILGSGPLKDLPGKFVASAESIGRERATHKASLSRET